ncbi:MAG: hypothetical protein AAGJ69_06485 [Cyanobacteria bacterium J06559_1]
MLLAQYQKVYDTVGELRKWQEIGILRLVASHSGARSPMFIKPEPIAPVPPLTQQVAKAAFPKGNPYMTLRDELGTVFEDADFTELFSTTGQPGLPRGGWR